MKRILAIILAPILPAAAGTSAGQTNESGEKMQTIARNGSQASYRGPADYFTGNVRIDPLFPATEQIPASGAYVTFEPGARSAWHMHPTNTGMAHLAITGAINGKNINWMKKVTDEQYNGR